MLGILFSWLNKASNEENLGSNCRLSKQPKYNSTTLVLENF